MQKTIMLLGALALGSAGCYAKAEARPETDNLETARPVTTRTPSAPVAEPGRKLFLDVHDVGRGKVTAQAVAGAHKKDLATEGKYGVDFKAYWVDQKQGKIYCLAEAPSAEAINQVHKEAHGLLANNVAQVTGDSPIWATAPGKKLYLDVHHFGAGKVNAQAVAGAHQKDLAAQGRHNVKYLNYWLDADSGTVMCLTEAPSAEAALAVHKEAHGLMPESIEEVSEGR
jgi:peptidyl-tRNA hydrolase